MADSKFKQIDACFSKLAVELVKAGVRAGDPIAVAAIKQAVHHTAEAAGLVRSLDGAPVQPNRKSVPPLLRDFDSVIQQTIHGQKVYPIVPREDDV